MSFKTLSATVIGAINNVLGEDITYTPNGSAGVTIKGVFDNAYVDVDGVVSLKPTLRIKLDDLEDPPAKGDEVTIESVDYSVSESREDGHGGTTLILKKI